MLVSFPRSGREYIWFSMSLAGRFPSNPCLPVWQKRQFILHPTCDETHSVALSLSGMKTVSTLFPEVVGKRYFTVPSFDSSLSRCGMQPMT